LALWSTVGSSSPDGRLIHLELHFGPSVVMVASEFPEHDALAPTTTGCTSSVFYLDVTDVDDLWRRALDAGASVHRPLADAFWGDREGQIIDLFGHRWGLSQHVRATRPHRGRATDRRCSPATSPLGVDAATTLDPFAM
jgi:uncharacterized glyoxalase superfamily protein PhnB